VFEIRVICQPDDIDRVSQALAAAFATGPARTYPTRDGKRTRLYVTADHQPAAHSESPTTGPAPEQAYALAPSIVREIGWTARTAAVKPFGTALGREFWLRKAAVLDRIALRDEADGIPSDAADVATEAARRLMDLDDVHGSYDPRAYVRQQYANYTHTTESE
jgi:hypothetical protein